MEDYRAWRLHHQTVLQLMVRYYWKRYLIKKAAKKAKEKAKKEAAEAARKKRARTFKEQPLPEIEKSPGKKGKKK